MIKCKTNTLIYSRNNMTKEFNEITEVIKDLPEIEGKENIFSESPKVKIDFENYIKNTTKKIKLQSKDWNFNYPLSSCMTIRDINDKLFDFTRLRSTDTISEIWFVNEVIEPFPFILEETGMSVILSEGILTQLLDEELNFEFQNLCTWSGDEIEVRLNGQ